MKPIVIALIAIAVIGSIAIGLSTNMSKAEEKMMTTSNMTHNMTHDTATILLDYQRIRPEKFIHLYDTTPFSIKSGHIAINVDCDDEGMAVVDLAVGVAPEMEIIKLDMKNMVHDLSEHGVMCLYHLDLPPEEGMLITDIALINNSNKMVRLGPEAGVVIHIHELGEAVDGHGSQEEGHGSMGGM